VKLAKLLHVIQPVGADAYRIDLSGPTAVLEETRRYGIALAKFLPALLACRDWALHARVKTPWGWSARLELSSEDRLVSHLPAPAEFDSSVEEAFAKKWGAEPRAGWSLLREARILSREQTTFVPDFLFRHKSGLEVMFEIVGFWTPECLAQKRETLERFKGERILLAVQERSERELAQKKRGSVNVVTYKTVIKQEPVLAVLKKVLASARRRAVPG
jgi:predicted nuclease of restriction endonuclease-like RecB superfamily